MLASLLLPSLLRGEALSPLSRQTLADRFWADSPAVEPRTHLRQCLTSLRDAFGADCLIADRHDAQIVPGWYLTDLELVFTAYRKALAAADIEERLYWLMEAEQEIRGEFFEGWTPDSEEARIWLILAQADLRSRLLPVLMLLSHTLEAVGNPTAAFDVTRRALLFQPGHNEARQRAWDLAVATGQQDVMHALTQVHSFRDAVGRFPTQSLNAVTIEDGRLFQSLFGADLARLAPGLRRALLRLSVFPAPFSVDMAEEICGVSRSTLEALSRTPFVQRAEGAFSITRMVRDCAWKRLAAPTRHRLQHLLMRLFVAKLADTSTPASVLPDPLGPADRARSILLSTLEWAVEQQSSLLQVQFISLLQYRGLTDLALQGVNSLQITATDASLPAVLRLNAGVSAAYILMQADDHAGAISFLEAGRSLAEAVSDRNWLATIYTTLMRAHSNLGDWETARQRGLKALEACRLVEDRQTETHCIRFLAEISLHAGDPEQALLLCEEAQELGRGLPPGSDYLPDALYWKAQILYRLQRWEASADAIEAALFLWQEAGDTKVGLCLCVMGQLHMQQERYAEARIHLEHAIDLHRRGAREGHRIATVEALGDLFCALHRHDEASARYVECLAYCLTKSHAPGVQRLQQKLERQTGRSDHPE